jgi:hypothetical protein
MIYVSKGAAHISSYNVLLLQDCLHINTLYLESTEGAFDTINLFIKTASSYYKPSSLGPDILPVTALAAATAGLAR